MILMDLNLAFQHLRLRILRRFFQDLLGLLVRLVDPVAENQKLRVGLLHREIIGILG